MSLIFLTCGTSLQILNFAYKYFPGNIYWNCLLGAVSDLLGIAISSVIFVHLGSTKTYRAGFATASIGGLLMLLYLHLTDFYS